MNPPFSLRRLLRWFALALAALLVVVVGVAVLRTWAWTGPSVVAQPPPPAILPDSALQHLSQAVRYQTVSYDAPAALDTPQFIAFQQFLRRAYPLVHHRLRLERVNQYTLIYRWQGTQVALRPAILLAHYDVVPVERATLAEWTYSPFSGVIAQGQIWGRGTTDNKGNVIAILEATEQLLRTGKFPARTTYFVFGHDEESGGYAGARAAARYFRYHRVHPAYVLDEGGFVTTQKVPGLQGKPVALIGTEEKGYLSLQLSATITGGHASMPDTVSAPILLARNILRLQAHPFPARFTPAMQGFAAHVGPKLPFLQRLAFANRGLLQSLILRTYTQTPAGAAAVRTTVAPTIFQAGHKENVIPASATATLNLRLLPGSTTQQTVSYLRALLDTRITLRPVGHVVEPSTYTASTDSLGYRVIAGSIEQQLPGVITTPFLFVAMSDSRHFSTLTPNIYKFSPALDPQGFHSVNEHTSCNSFARSIGFYQQLLVRPR